jgi:RNA polymerase sigma-70 factor (ECF subfamily)
VQPELEADLIARVCRGEHEVFYELVRPHERGIFMAALSIVNNDADAEEVVQEAILKAFKAIGKFRGEAKFSTWIIQITINEARMRLRKDRRHLYDSLDESRKGEKMKATTFPGILPTGAKFPQKPWRVRDCAKL